LITGFITPAEIEQLPEAPGLYRLHSQKGVIASDITSNLRRTLERLCTSRPESTGEAGEPDIHGISYEPSGSLLEAYLALRFDDEPGMAGQFRYYSRNLGYLAVDFTPAPRLRIADTPMGGAFYLGPFSSRFMLSDVIDLFVERGLADPEMEDPSGTTGRNLHPELLMRTLLGDGRSSAFGPPLKIGMRREYEELLDNLDFAAAEAVKGRMRLLDDFYGEINFLLTTKSMNLELNLGNWTAEVRDGLLTRVRRDGVTFFEGPGDTQEYQPGEELAVPLDQRLERWMIFQYAKNHLHLPFDELSRAPRIAVLARLGFDAVQERK
jgi:hypothetical protein